VARFLVSLRVYPPAQEVAMKPDAIARRVCTEFIEMPGLRLTFSQAVRLLGLPPTVCRRVVDELVASGI
jgi:DNA-binding Lrp family transcriptional regulator